MMIYLPFLDCVLDGAAPVLEDWLLAHGGVAEPPHREGGYALASEAVERWLFGLALEARADATATHHAHCQLESDREWADHDRMFERWRREFARER